MSKINDGGPAFPASWHPEMGWSPRDTPPGMSLRDWLAGQALAGWLASFEDDQHPIPSASAQYEGNPWRLAYEMADAMLAARDKPVADRASFIELRDMLAHLLDTCVMPEMDFKRGHKILAKARGET